MTIIIDNLKFFENYIYNYIKIIYVYIKYIYALILIKIIII